MTGKLFFFALLAALVLVNVHGEDDFKEDVEEIENMEQEIEEDESEEKEPRAFRFRGFSRRSGTRSGLGTRSGTRTRTGGIFRRTRTSGGSSGGSTGSRIFRRTRTSGGGSSGSRIFRRNRSGTRSGGTRGGNTGGGTGTWQKIGTVLGIAELGTTLATTTLGLLSNVERKIVISLGNLEGVDWTGSTSYMNQGSSVKVLPLEVATEEGIQMAGVKNAGPSTTGVSGVFCYRFQFIEKSFCLMYKVPYSGDNYWNVKVFDGAKQASKEMYDTLQDGATKAGNPIARKDIGEGDGYKIYLKDCSMTNSGQAVLQVYLGIES